MSGCVREIKREGGRGGRNTTLKLILLWSGAKKRIPGLSVLTLLKTVF